MLQPHDTGCSDSRVADTAIGCRDGDRSTGGFAQQIVSARVISAPALLIARASRAEPGLRQSIANRPGVRPQKLAPRGFESRPLRNPVQLAGYRHPDKISTPTAEATTGR